MTRPPEAFTTARLQARPPRVADAARAFAVYAGDPMATRYLSFLTYHATEPLERFFREREAAWAGATTDAFAWLLFLRDDPTQLVGSIGVTLNDHAALFGYAIGREYWGRGLTAEALTWLVDWSLAQPVIFRAWAFCDVENLSSARVMEKAGMAREGLLRRWHVAPNLSAEPRDCFAYAKVR